MATSSTTGTGSLSMYDNTIRYMGSSSNLDINSLIEAEIQMMQAKDQPYIAQQTNYKSEQTGWNTLKSTMQKLVDLAASFKNMTFNSKEVSTTEDGYAGITADDTALTGSYNLSIANVATYHKVMSDGVADSTMALGYDGTVKINGQELAISSDLSLTDIAKKINDGAYGVNSVVIGGHLMMTSKQTGSTNQISFEDSNSILQNLGIITSTGTVKNEIQQAKDAQFSVDGIQMTSSNNSVKDAIPGVTINLTKATTADITFSIDENQENYKTQVKDFINTYNTTIQKINDLTGKEAVLQGKSGALKAKTDMANLLYKDTSSTLRLFQVGIEIDGTAKNGTLKLNEATLDSQLENNPKEVEKLLTGDNGFIQQAYDQLNNLTKANGTFDTAIQGLDTRIKNIQDTLDRNQTMYDQQKQTLLNKMSAYESLMSQWGSYGDYMNNMLSSLNGSNN